MNRTVTLSSVLECIDVCSFALFLDMEDIYNLYLAFGRPNCPISSSFRAAVRNVGEWRDSNISPGFHSTPTTGPKVLVCDEGHHPYLAPASIMENPIGYASGTSEIYVKLIDTEKTPNGLHLFPALLQLYIGGATVRFRENSSTHVLQINSKDVSLSEVLFFSRSVKKIELDYINFEALPERCYIDNLEIFVMTGNRKITAVPKSLAVNAKKLRIVHITGCPLLKEIPEVWLDRIGGSQQVQENSKSFDHACAEIVNASWKPIRGNEVSSILEKMLTFYDDPQKDADEELEDGMWPKNLVVDNDDLYAQCETYAMETKPAVHYLFALSRVDARYMDARYIRSSQ